VALELNQNEYSQFALRTAPGDDWHTPRADDDEPMTITKRQYRLLLGAIGLCGEAGEVAELVKKHVVQGHPLDEQKMEKELGDVAWYHNYLTVRGICSTLGRVFYRNIEKLAARYPEGVFSSFRSLNRKDGDD
jgi:NTP pyrophosphatase (non-canonical NTP hydrolase)